MTHHAHNHIATRTPQTQAEIDRVKAEAAHARALASRAATDASGEGETIARPPRHGVECLCPLCD